MFPPGRARLGTNPTASASQAYMTMGMVEVAVFAAAIAWSPNALMISTRRSTSSRARVFMRSCQPSPNRYSIAMLCFSE